MGLEHFLFYLFSALLMASSVAVWGNRKVIDSAFLLLLSFFSVAALFIFAFADFLAVTQLVVYIGGILVLLIFGVMFTYRNHQESPTSKLHFKGQGVLLSLLVFAGLTWLIVQNFPVSYETSSLLNVPKTTTPEIGKLLMTRYLLAFELLAFFLLVVLVGAVVVASRQEQ